MTNQQPDRIETLGHGVTRLHCNGVGYADVSAEYADTSQGWTVTVQRTNIQDAPTLEAVITAFRTIEGL